MTFVNMQIEKNYLSLQLDLRCYHINSFTISSRVTFSIKRSTVIISELIIFISYHIQLRLSLSLQRNVNSLIKCEYIIGPKLQKSITNFEVRSMDLEFYCGFSKDIPCAMTNHEIESDSASLDECNVSHVYF